MKAEEPAAFERSCQLEDTLNQRRRALGRDPVYLTRFGRPLREVFAHDQLVLPLLDPADPGQGADLGVCESGYRMT